MKRVRIAMPDSATRGEIIEIKTLVRHPMETGFRRDRVGKLIPRDILTEFVCRYNGTEIFRAEFFPAVAANPFLTFHAKVTASGSFEFQWTDQTAGTFSETMAIKVV